MVADCCRSTPKSKVVHKKGPQSLGWESYMFFSSKDTIYCQADSQLWPKMTNSGATLAQIICAHGCRHLQKHSKVKFGSQAKIMMTGIWMEHGVLSQPQHSLPSWPPILAQNKHIQGWFGPNDMCKWLENAAEAFQSQNWFMSKVNKPCDENRTWPFHSNKPFGAKLPSNLAKNGQFDGFSGPNHMC